MLSLSDCPPGRMHTSCHYSEPKAWPRSRLSVHKSDDDDDDYVDFPNILLPGSGIYNPVETDETQELGFFHYRNIRYGQAPVRNIRFTPPVAPEPVQDKLPEFDGSEGYSCYQTAPQWVIDAYNSTGRDWEEESRTGNDGDDCLFLDVAIPDSRMWIVASRSSRGFMAEAMVSSSPHIATLVLTVTVYGAKDWPIYNPAGFFRRAWFDDEDIDPQPFVFVALIYRVPIPNLFSSAGILTYSSDGSS